MNGYTLSIKGLLRIFLTNVLCLDMKCHRVCPTLIFIGINYLKFMAANSNSVFWLEIASLSCKDVAL